MSRKNKPAPSVQRNAAEQYQIQSRRLGQYTSDQEDNSTGPTQAVQARFVTAQDPVIEVANGGRLPAVPLEEAVKLNVLKDQAEGRRPRVSRDLKTAIREARDGTVHGVDLSSIPSIQRLQSQSSQPEASLRESVPQTCTNPLFPPLPLWGPPSLLRNVQCYFFRATSAVLSFCFLWVIILGALFTDMLVFFKHLWMRITLEDPSRKRPYSEEEERRATRRLAEEKAWFRTKRQKRDCATDEEKDGDSDEEFTPTEGGPDKLICDVGYYARRVGLDCETFLVQTEDGFVLELWHIFNPRDRCAVKSPARDPDEPDVFPSKPKASPTCTSDYPPGQKKYPVLLIHGLLQSAGAYCSTDESSLAFYLAKSGYDVWLGNNRCGFTPRHSLLHYGDPRMWAWNIRQMGVMDLPALISRVLSETGFPKLALVAHSQGTTQTLVALAKEQRPDIGSKLSVFCALAPAAYAGPLIGKAYFKFMHLIPPALFRCVFGIHAFIPFMMSMHAVLPAKLYGYMGYRIFSFLFNWSDERWDQGLRDRCFIFAPVYVSAESMRWWLGRECFARQKCILATREEGWIEDREDEEEEEEEGREEEEEVRKRRRGHFEGRQQHLSEQRPEGEKFEHGEEGREDGISPSSSSSAATTESDRYRYAWYDAQVPPLAFWVAGADNLVDGRRLLRRFERGREPHVDVVHAKIIPSYEHLDVIWAMDAIEQVGKEVKEVIWRTAGEVERGLCRVPRGCEGVGFWKGRAEERRGT